MWYIICSLINISSPFPLVESTFHLLFLLDQHFILFLLLNRIWLSKLICSIFYGKQKQSIECVLKDGTALPSIKEENIGQVYGGAIHWFKEAHDIQIYLCSCDIKLPSSLEQILVSIMDISVGIHYDPLHNFTFSFLGYQLIPLFPDIPWCESGEFDGCSWPLHWTVNNQQIRHRKSGQVSHGWYLRFHFGSKKTGFISIVYREIQSFFQPKWNLLILLH